MGRPYPKERFLVGHEMVCIQFYTRWCVGSSGVLDRDWSAGYGRKLGKWLIFRTLVGNYLILESFPHQRGNLWMRSLLLPRFYLFAVAFSYTS